MARRRFQWEGQEPDCPTGELLEALCGVNDAFPPFLPTHQNVVATYVTPDTEVGHEVGSLLQTHWQVIVLAIVTQLDIAYAIRVLCYFV